MITPQEVTESLATIANSWKSVAVFWHVIGIVLLVSLLAGPFQPRERLAPLLVVPLASVALFAWSVSSIFNGVIFVVLSAALLFIGIRLRPGKVLKAHAGMQLLGAAVMVFALVYPHFVAVDAMWKYLFYSPVGLLPCPTLSLVVGASIIANGFASRAWSFTLACFGLFYGITGAAWLGVQLDWVLVAASIVLFIQGIRLRTPDNAAQSA